LPTGIGTCRTFRASSLLATKSVTFVFHLQRGAREHAIAMSFSGASRQKQDEWTRGSRTGILVLIFMCCLYNVDVIKSAKGAYLEISSSSKHVGVALTVG
jgi:hypothetical protein